MTLTIEITEETALRLRAEATRRGQGAEELAGALLGLVVQQAKANRDLSKLRLYHYELEPLAGTWSEEDLQAFEEATALTRQIEKTLVEQS
jgi:hypothetical protein